MIYQGPESIFKDRYPMIIVQNIFVLESHHKFLI